ncbi:MAG: hypothetical protein FWH27_10940 [Planctomycetaceae bacterium]|nr:hypothetical protein [Planctomycetaceae bacterium]
MSKRIVSNFPVVNDEYPLEFHLSPLAPSPLLLEKLPLDETQVFPMLRRTPDSFKNAMVGVCNLYGKVPEITTQNVDRSSWNHTNNLANCPNYRNRRKVKVMPKIMGFTARLPQKNSVSGQKSLTKSIIMIVDNVSLTQNTGEHDETNNHVDTDSCAAVCGMEF